MTSHIPDKGQVTIRYFGLYANAHRGKVRKAQPDKHPFIINHLKLIFMAERPPPPHLVYQEFLMAAETGAEYFS